MQPQCSPPARSSAGSPVLAAPSTPAQAPAALPTSGPSLRQPWPPASEATDVTPGTEGRPLHFAGGIVARGLRRWGGLLPLTTVAEATGSEDTVAEETVADETAPQPAPKAQWPPLPEEAAVHSVTESQQATLPSAKPQQPWPPKMEPWQANDSQFQPRQASPEQTQLSLQAAPWDRMVQVHRCTPTVQASSAGLAGTGSGAHSPALRQRLGPAEAQPSWQSAQASWFKFAAKARC